MNPQQFAIWLRQSKRGATTIYHTGLLMNDRQKLGNWTGYKAVDGLAQEVMYAYETGRVMLFQRRLSPGVCAYIAARV